MHESLQEPTFLDTQPRLLDGAVDFALSAFCLPALVLEGLWGGWYAGSTAWAAVLAPLCCLVFAGLPADRHVATWERVGARFAGALLVALIAGFVLWVYREYGMAWQPALIAAALSLVHGNWRASSLTRAQKHQRAQWLHTVVFAAAGLALFVMAMTSLAIMNTERGFLGGTGHVVAVQAAAYFFFCGLAKAFWRPALHMRRRERRW
jgi:hypothetical protein